MTEILKNIKISFKKLHLRISISEAESCGAGPKSVFKFSIDAKRI
jgi:hypothetical protein